MESHDPSVIPAISQVVKRIFHSLYKPSDLLYFQALKMTKDETQRLQGKRRGFLSSFW
jgi:hypothetical protein